MASPLPRFERLPCPSVQLLHELPGGDSHIDWMIARDPEGAQPLLSFRAARRLDDLDAGETMTIQRIADHRPAYLDYEGAVSNDLGTVARLIRGQLLATAPSPLGRSRLLRIRWIWPGHQADVIQTLRLAPEETDQWSISCVSRHEAPSAAAAGLAQEES